MTTSSESPEFHFNQGLSHVAAQRWEEARACFEQTILLQPNWVDAYNNLGGVLGELGQLEEAATRFQQALRLSPNFFKARGNLALIFLKQERLDEAEACFRQHITLQPDAADSWHNVAIILHRKALRHQYDYVQFQKKNWLEEAIAFCQEAIRLRPASPQTFYHQGNLLQALGRPDEAAASFMHAVQLDPSLETAHFNIAAYYKLKGELEKAIACYRRVLELQPNNSTARFLLAATSGKDQPASAPAQYLTELFDDYAERFEDHLVKELGYRGPQSLRAAIPDRPAPQTVTVSTLTLTRGSTITLNDTIKGNTAVSQYSQLVASSNINLVGNLQLDLASGFSPYLNEQFTIIHSLSTNPISGSRSAPNRQSESRFCSCTSPANSYTTYTTPLPSYESNRVGLETGS